MTSRHLRAVPGDDGFEAEMTCEHAREVLLDGASPSEQDRAAQHGETCTRCDAGLLTPALPSTPQADGRLLGALAILVLSQAVLAGPWVLGFDPYELTAMDEAHLARDGAVGLLAAAAGAITLYRPRYAQPSFMLASAGLIMQAVASAFDSSNERIAVGDEAVHVLSLLLVLLLGMVAISLKNSLLKRLR